jgi:hypothetical protein
VGRSAVALFAILIGLTFVVIPKPAWALTIAPDPPIAGQPFSISGYGPGAVFVFTGSGCGGSVVFQSGPLRGGAYNVTVPGLPMGQYHVTVPENIGCVNFTIIPASTTAP